MVLLGAIFRTVQWVGSTTIFRQADSGPGVLQEVV
jgi:hypothetical protein